jgi:hypothetical protein
MPDENNSTLWGTEFRLGPQETSLLTLLGESRLKSVQAKFPNVPVVEWTTALQETVRYLFLVAYSPKGLFFPGDELMDDLWHALLLETSEYRTLCFKLRPGCFLEHSGIKFSEYTKSSSSKEMHEEQLSWLASYVYNFGPFEERAYRHLLLARSLSDRLDTDLNGLNEVALLMFQNRPLHPDFDPAFELNNFLESVVNPVAEEIAENPITLCDTAHQLVQSLTHSRQLVNLDSPQALLSNSELTELFSCSTSLAFVLWQHLAAVERLADAPDWQQDHSILWKELASGGLLCGLATTHLATGNGKHAITAERTKDGYSVSGIAPWVSGNGIFRHLIIAFDCKGHTLFALIDFPNPIEIRSNTFHITPLRLACLNGTSTIEIKFNDYFISADQIISSRTTDRPVRPRSTTYRIPDIGIALGALNAAEGIIKESDPRRPQILETIKVARETINSLRLNITCELSTLENDHLVYKKDAIIRDSVRLLALASGGRGLKDGAKAARLQSEILLLDAVIQSPDVMNRKIVEIKRTLTGNNQ